MDERTAAMPATLLDAILLTRAEDAGINASAPPQQRWLDGWILRFCPGKAKRARCINAVAEGRLPLDMKLQLAASAYSEAGLPLVLRITPYTQPPGLDAQLEQRGYTLLDHTRVMVFPHLPQGDPAPLPQGTHWAALDAPTFAEEVGAMRASPLDQQHAHAQRLALSPVPYRGYAIRRDGDGQVLACGQCAREAELVGLYDICTRVSERGRGLARNLCERLLALAVSEAAQIGYLQVEGDNYTARRLYTALGFVDAYAYHYRVAP